MLSWKNADDVICTLIQVIFLLILVRSKKLSKGVLMKFQKILLSLVCYRNVAKLASLR